MICGSGTTVLGEIMSRYLLTVVAVGLAAGVRFRVDIAKTTTTSWR